VYKAIFTKIIDGLYLGDEEGLSEAERRGYSVLAACKDGSPDCHRAVLGYTGLGAPKDKNYYFVQRGDHMALNLIDSEDPAFIPDEVIDAGLNFLKQERDAGKKIFVHCIAGHSRSTSIMLMFLRAIGEMPERFLRAEHKFRTLYPEYDPGKGMRAHTRRRWDELLTFFTR
jgi:hypothetical protein